ncbi:hypothetical protein [Bifidobacterium felsineum]|uniref:hypothetical protein n=1 Tax=Bifidobacterium felsineum TaxID=2045440 RepID=UPI001BDC92B0|nr:hypothetical protein [Bifidobacterium felsineum]MBT1164827.1 hypothetical protein [Bifidobacterium felsineum]
MCHDVPKSHHTDPIGGLPQDYGQFNGNQAYGFDADAKAKIRVWWAGSGTGDSKEDQKYKPTDANEPTADAHHKLIGEWEVPAGNGTYKVGGGRITFRQNNTGDAKTVATGVDIQARNANETGWYVFVYDFPGSSRAQAFKSDYNDPWERSFVETGNHTVDLTSDVSKTEVAQGETFHDTAHITGQVARGSYVEFTAWDAVNGSPDQNATKLLDHVKVPVTDAQADNSDRNAFDVTSPDISTRNVGNVYWQAALYDPNGQELASHPLGLENETVIVRGITVTTKTSSSVAYPGQKFHDTATITGKLQAGYYVTFDAYGPAATYQAGLPKILDGAKVTIPNNLIASSDWNKSIDIDSPDITASGEGNVYWVATVHAADGTVLADHKPGVAGETVQLLKPGVTTHVNSTSVGVGEQFNDKADVSGIVQEGDYVVFRAYNPVSGDPDTNAGLLLNDVKVVFTAAQAKASISGTVTVESPKVSTLTPGKVYWQAELHAKDGTLLATHDLGLPEETVTVTPPTITTTVSQQTAGLGEKFSDKATITGRLQKGSSVRFRAYKPVNGTPDTNAGVLYEKTVQVSDQQVKDSASKPITVDSGETSADKPGNVYWMAELLAPDGTKLADHELGLITETVTVTPPSITTAVNATQAGLGEKFSDKAKVSGRVLRGSTVRFRAYNPVDGKPDTNAGVLYEKTVNVTDAQADASATTSFTVDSGETSTMKAGKVYWIAELLDPNGTVVATHDLGLPEETVTVTPPSITTNVSSTQVGRGETFHDSAKVTGKVLNGSSVRFTAYKPVTGDPDPNAGILYEETVKITDEQASKSSVTPFTVTSKDTKTDDTGKVYWKAELLDPNGTVIADHELGLPSETVTVRPATITTHVSSIDVGLGQEFNDKATVTGKVLPGSTVRFTAYNPVDLGPDTNAGILYQETVKVSDEQAANSVTTPFTVESKKTSTMKTGNVYWLAELLDPDGKVMAKHDLGLPEETVRVTPPKITTQVTRETAKPGQEFADKATISGKVERGSYVTFTAYEPVPGDPDTTVGKLLDEAKVMISDKDADASAKVDFTVTSPMTKTDKAGSVYWKATLHAPDGTVISSHDLGLPSETTYIAPGGYLSSQAQAMGATGEPLYDVITVYNESDGHEGNGNGNPHGLIGSIPSGSIVTVEAYRQDGNNTASKSNLLGTHDFPVDITQMRDGKLTFKAQDKAFTMNDPGLVYWVATLKTANGAVLDKAVFGESGDQHGTGVESQERTPVQEYDTTISKKWFSVNSDEYEEKTVSVYDVLKQTSWRQHKGDVATLIGQTADGTKYRFEVWKQGDGDQSTDRLMWTGADHEMPQSKLTPNDPKSDSVWQQMKSETFTIGRDWTPGAYYVRVLVTNPNVDNTVEGKRNVVKYTKARDEKETFRVFKVTSTSAERLWTSNQKHVQDILHVNGTMPKGSSYLIEVWTTDDKGDSVKKVSESKKITLDRDVTDTDIKGPVMDNPGQPGGYQFRFRIWSPDNLGGDPDIDQKSILLPDTWKQGDGYAQKNLIYEGRNVPAEHFEIVKITTKVAGTANIHSYKGENYVNVTHATQVGDHADIEGRMLDGYQLGFELYRKDSSDDASKDVKVAEIQPVDLQAAQKSLDSALTDLDTPGDYYWVWVFQKKDGSKFQPDGETQVRSDRRVKEESFHAARITTTTAKWTTNGGETKDVALIEGCVPQDAIARFDLHDYETGETVASTKDKTLKQLGYRECSDGNTSQTIESDTVTVPAAHDHYFVESVRFPGEDEDHGFHRGDSKVPYESTRSIDATTETYTQLHLGDAVSDQTNLLNIKYSKGDGKDIRDDLTGPLTASWEVWKQSSGDDESKDVKLTTLADGENAIRLESGQTTVDSPEWKPSQTGVYYFRVIIKDENGKTLKYGAAREPSETIRIIDSRSQTLEVVEEGKPIHDKVTIEGPVLEGTMIGWDVYTMGKGTADADKLTETWDTPKTGAYVITAEDAAKAAKDGRITITSPKAYAKGKAGDRPYFVYKLYAPKRDGKTGEPVKPVKGTDGVYTTAHLMSNTLLPIGEDPVDGDEATPEEDPTAFHIDVARTPSETSSVIKITTTVSTHDATVGSKIHDTAHITGYVPDGYCIRFEYWQQHDGPVSNDRLILTTDCVTVKPGATDVDSPDITADKSGTFYWREKLVPNTPNTPGTPDKPTGPDSDRPEKPTGDITYGKPRVPGETVVVHPLAETGVGMGPILGVTLLAGLLGLGFTLIGRRRNRRLD